MKTLLEHSYAIVADLSNCEIVGESLATTEDWGDPLRVVEKHTRARDEEVRRDLALIIADMIDARADQYMDEFGNFKDQWNEGAYDALAALACELRESFTRSVE